MTDEEALFEMRPEWDLADAMYDMARRQGYQQALLDIADYLEKAGQAAMWQRIQDGADLRDGTWKNRQQPKGLHTSVLMDARIKEARRRGLAVEDMPEEWRPYAVAKADKALEERRRHREEVARILREEHGLEMP